MERKRIETRDGSHSIAIPELQLTYHSIHGAEQESNHVFIKAGLEYWLQQNGSTSVRILEMGFGTGLNALLTLEYASQHGISVEYSSIEKFPISMELAEQLNYCDSEVRMGLRPEFLKMHSSEWGLPVEIRQGFQLTKLPTDLIDLQTPAQPWQLVYFDAFAPGAQPELWTMEVFAMLASMCEMNAILTTYCSKGDVRRNMQAAGWMVEKIPGPPGKREMLRGEVRGET